MSEFLFIYRGGRASPRSAEQMQQVMQKWQAWMQQLAQKGHLKDRGHPLEPTGKLVASQGKTITDGPYAEKDVVGGYTLVEAADLTQATALSAGCPILEVGGSVEVRPVMQMSM
jgi:hypothetical protein